MPSVTNRKNRKRCKGMSTPALRKLVTQLEPEVREASSLLECAKRELHKRRKEEKCLPS